MEDYGFDVEIVHSGEDAIGRVKEETYQVILLDIKMPVMNGVEVYKRVKGMCHEKGTAVIMMTAYSVDELISDAIKRGVYAVLRKPLDINEVLDVIKQAKEGALILIVEDDPAVSESLKNLLEDNGFRVVVMASGEKAVEYAKKNTEDIVFLDIKLPVMSGLEAYLRMKEYNPNMIALIMTAYRDEVSDIVDQALKSDCYACLYKPMNPKKSASDG